MKQAGSSASSSGKAYFGLRISTPGNPVRSFISFSESGALTCTLIVCSMSRHSDFVGVGMCVAACLSHVFPIGDLSPWGELR